MLEVYRVKDLEYSHEKRQARELLDRLDLFFKNFKNERQYIILDPRTNGLPQTEAIVYYRGNVLILELKDYVRRVYPKLTGHWEAEDVYGNIVQITGQGENPFHQVRRQRERFIEVFAKMVYGYEKIDLPSEINHKIRKDLYAWIITARNSAVVRNYDEREWWRKVLPLNEELTVALSMFGLKPKNSITEDEFLKFARAISAIYTTPDYWSTGPIVPELEDSRSYIVERLLQSFDPKEIEKGLTYSEELKLINCFTLIQGIIPRLDYEQRLKAFELLFDWIKKYPNKYLEKVDEILRLALDDDKNTIRRVGLEYMVLGSKQYSTEILSLVSEKLQTETWFDNIDLLVSALEFFENKDEVTRIIQWLYRNRVSVTYFSTLSDIVVLREDRKALAFDGLRARSDKALNKLREIEHVLTEKRKQLSGWDSVMDSVFKLSSSVGLQRIGEMIWEYLKSTIDILRTDPHGISISSKLLKGALGAIGSLKPQGVADELVKLLNETDDDYLKYLVIGTLGDLGDSGKLDVISPFLSYDNDNSDVEPEHMRIQASDALSKLGDVNKFTEIWDLFVAQADKEVRLEGDRSYFHSLRRLDCERLERMIWREIEKSQNLENALSNYSEFVRNCGSELSFAKCKQMLLQKGDLFAGWWYSPSSTIVSLSWRNPRLQSLAVSTGIEFLELGGDDIKYIGLDLAESYFLANIAELAKYENSENREILFRVVYLYARVEDREKTESYLRNKDKEVADLAFDRLSEMSPSVHFEDFHLIRRNHIYDCEFIICDSGLALHLENVNGHIIQPWQYVQLIPWKRIEDLKTIFKDRAAIGLLFADSEGGVAYSALVPRGVAQWNYLVSGSIALNSEMSEILSKVKTKLGNEKSEAELVATSNVLMEILKKAFMKESEISDFGDKKLMKHMEALFNEHFSSSMFHLQ